MQKLTEKISQLDQQKPRWQEWYVSNEYLDVSCKEPSRAILESIIELVLSKEKQLIDCPDSQADAEWKQQICELIGENVYQKMLLDTENVRNIYARMKIIRDGSENTILFLSDVFEQFAFPYNRFYTEQELDRYGIEDTAALKKAARALKTVIRTHVRERFSKYMARTEFERVTGILEPFSSYYAGLYVKYFDSLQRKCLFDHMEIMDKKLDYIISLLEGDEACEDSAQ